MIRPTIAAASLEGGAAIPAFERAFTTVDLMAYGAATWDSGAPEQFRNQNIKHRKKNKNPLALSAASCSIPTSDD